MCVSVPGRLWAPHGLGSRLVRAARSVLSVDWRASSRMVSTCLPPLTRPLHTPSRPCPRTSCLRLTSHVAPWLSRAPVAAESQRTILSSPLIRRKTVDWITRPQESVWLLGRRLHHRRHVVYMKPGLCKVVMGAPGSECKEHTDISGHGVRLHRPLTGCGSSGFYGVSPGKYRCWGPTSAPTVSGDGVFAEVIRADVVLVWPVSR